MEYKQLIAQDCNHTRTKQKPSFNGKDILKPFGTNPRIRSTGLETDCKPVLLPSISTF